MSTRSLILSLNESEESYKSDKSQRMYSQPVGQQGSYINRYGTKTPTISGRAQRLLRYPVGHEGSYYIR